MFLHQPDQILTLCLSKFILYAVAGPSVVVIAKLLGLIGLSTSATLVILAPVPKLPSLWHRPVCTQEIELEDVSNEGKLKQMRLRVWAPTVPRFVQKFCQVIALSSIGSTINIPA